LIDGGFDWVDVRDVVSSMLAAEERGQRGENYILSGRWYSISELAAFASAVTGVRAPPIVTPMWLARIGAPFVTSWGQLTRREPLYTSESLAALRASREIDNSKAVHHLGHVARPTEQTVRDVYDWFESAGLLARSGQARERG